MWYNNNNMSIVDYQNVKFLNILQLFKVIFAIYIFGLFFRNILLSFTCITNNVSPYQYAKEETE